MTHITSRGSRYNIDARLSEINTYVKPENNFEIYQLLCFMLKIKADKNESQINEQTDILDIILKNFRITCEKCVVHSSIYIRQPVGVIPKFCVYSFFYLHKNCDKCLIKFYEFLKTNRWFGTIDCIVDCENYTDYYINTSFEHIKYDLSGKISPSTIYNLYTDETAYTKSVGIYTFTLNEISADDKRATMQINTYLHDNSINIRNLLLPYLEMEENVDKINIIKNRLVTFAYAENPLKYTWLQDTVYRYIDKHRYCILKLVFDIFRNVVSKYNISNRPNELNITALEKYASERQELLKKIHKI